MKWSQVCELMVRFGMAKKKIRYGRKLLPFALLSDSLKSSAPLKRRVARHITAETLQRVARAGRDEQRRLYAGTVNYDTGKLVIWDLTAIAMDDTNPDRLELYRQVVLASASIPILVPPVGVVARASTNILALDDPALLCVSRHIRDHACEGMRVTDALRNAGVSRRTLEKRFRRRFGRSLHAEVDRVRFDRATNLLATTCSAA